MPTKSNSAEKFSIYLKIYNECVFNMHDELRAFFYEYIKNKNFSEDEITELNNYNRKSISAFVDMFMKK